MMLLLPGWSLSLRAAIAAAMTAAVTALADVAPATAGEGPSGVGYAAPPLPAMPWNLASPAAAPLPVGHHAEGVDTEHIFGFSMGSDIGEPGEVEYEVENVFGFGKRAGSYSTLASLAQVKYTVNDRLRVAPGIAFGGQRIVGVPGYDDHRDVSFNGATFEVRYKLIDRATAPFGLTLHAQPGWGRVDEGSGGRVEQYGGEFAALFDRELIAKRLYAAFNLWYGTGATRDSVTSAWSHDSHLQVHAAVSGLVTPALLLGIGVRYLRTYDGGGFDRFVGDAVYVGPSFSYSLSETVGLSGTWQMQLAGRALGDGRPLNLDQFERHQAMLRLNLHF